MKYELLKYVLFLCSFAVSLLAVFILARVNKKNGVMGIDINKTAKKMIPESAGLGLLVPLILGVAAYAYVEGLRLGLVAWLMLISGFAIVGFLDDINHKFLKQTLAWRTRAVAVGLISLLFAIVYAPSLFWALPIAIFIAVIASFQNTFAGLNGWEVGSGFIISLFVCAALYGTAYFLIGIIISGAILGLLIWNKYPAKVFPGDSGTLIIGGGIASLIVLAHRFELIALCILFYLPHMLDFALKMISNPKDPSQVKIKPYALNKEGKICIPKYSDGKIRYDFAKFLMRIFGPMKEWQIVLIIWIIVSLNCALWLFLFSNFGLI